jgi:hypothetical protein
MMEAQEEEQEHSTAAAAEGRSRAATPAEIEAMLSSMDNTNPIYEPEPEDTPHAPNPFIGDGSRAGSCKAASPMPTGATAGSSQRVSSGSIGWQQQQQQQGEVRTSTALAYAEVTGGVCHVNLLPVPEPMTRARAGSPAAAAATGALPSAVSSAPPAAAAPVAKKVGWFSRTLGAHGKVARHQHRYAALASQPQHDDQDVALLDQAGAALSDTEQDVGGDASSPERRAGAGSRVADQALLRAGAGGAGSQGKHSGSGSSKWKKQWQKLGFRGKSSSSAAAASAVDVRPVRG